MRKAIITWLLTITALSAVAVNPAPVITVAVAANMQFAMQSLTRNFTKETGIQCNLVVSSSGKLTAQIKVGAPYDLFVSADMKYPETLYKAGLALEKPKIYAYGKLVLWSMDKSIKPSLKTLQSHEIKHIACANPKTAPYGLATIQVLKYKGIYNSVKSKLVYGESISQTNQFITSKSAQIGFTAKSVVLSPEMKGKGSWIELNPSSYTPIAQGVIIVKQDQAEEISARKFYSYLFSAQAKKILKNFGYSVK